MTSIIAPDPEATIFASVLVPSVISAAPRNVLGRSAHRDRHASRPGADASFSEDGNWRTRNPVSLLLFGGRVIRCRFFFSRVIRCRFFFSGKNNELPSREGAPGGLDRASGFPFPL